MKPAHDPILGLFFFLVLIVWFVAYVVEALE
jgi:hypothetical protein